MKYKILKCGLFVTLTVFCLGCVSGCSTNKKESKANAKQEVVQDIKASDAGMLVEGTFRPSDAVIESKEKYEYPFIGLSVELPKTLMIKMDKKEIAMLQDEGELENRSAISYAILHWNVMTESQKNAEVAKMGDGYSNWVNSLQRVGTLGVYHSNVIKKIDTLTGCTKHKEIGKSKDGKYYYYLSINPKADKKLTDEVLKIKVKISDMAPYEKTSAFSQLNKRKSIKNIGKFNVKDVHGKGYTEDIFKDSELTMVNVFATWCTACIKEITDLEKLNKEMAKRKVKVVGVVTDTLNNSSEDKEAINKAKVISERTGATYPFLIPDSKYFNGRLDGIQAYPQTFFVDKNGNIVGQTYEGSHGLKEWRKIVESELQRIKEKR